jgi:hypothetical protein
MERKWKIMPKKNPNPAPTNCSICGARLIKTGERTAEPWPEEELLYTVEIYTCSNSDCSGSKKPLEYWPVESD